MGRWGLIFIFSFALASAQQVWLEPGVAYREDGAGNYEALFRLGVKGFYPLSEPLSLYGSFAWRDGVMADAGVWYAFDPNFTDPVGFQTYGGAGLTVVGGEIGDGGQDETRFGLALSIAVQYVISDTFGVAVTYTHRPLLLPSLAQTFDISLGLTINLETIPGSAP